MTSSPTLPRTLRENIETASIAILMAIGLKYFLVEAYEIPTPSMQPTLMGSVESGVKDRILVNKAAYLSPALREPRRFDVAVFRYPHNRSQNYVKRIVGLGGERLRIEGGDVFRLEGRPPLPRICRKRAGIQAAIWKLVFDQESAARPRETFHTGSAKGLWHFADGDAALVSEDTGEGARLRVMPPGEPTDHYWHGYPASIEEQIRIEGQGVQESGPVGDLRWTLRLAPDGKVTKVWLEQRESPRIGYPRAFRLELERRGTDRARALLVYEEFAQGWGPSRKRVERELADLAFGAGEPIELVLANVDDELRASAGGQSFEALPYEARPSNLDSLRFEIGQNGGRAVRFAGLRLERDLYYTQTGLARGEVIAVPEDHLWMLGDNTQKSADGREWRTLSIWVGEDGSLARPGAKDARRITGNYRYAPWNNPHDDPDENPVFVESARRIVFTDLEGEEHVIRGREAEFDKMGYPTQSGRFVPARYLAGRAFAIFWPANPLGQFRLGFIR